ncbi:MAG: hypothetical protein J6J42_11310 [Lachnospiraceae bacterium]|nr:hypothetical protein [Lachnospiraceae bacterium]
MREEKKQERAPLFVAGVLALALVICLVLLAGSLLKRGWEHAEDNEELQVSSMAGYEMEKEQTSEEVPEETQKPGGNTPGVLEDDTDCVITEMEAEVFRYLGEVYVARKNGYYGLTDLEGNWLTEPEFDKFVYYDQDWVSFEDATGITHVFDRSGKQLYEYACEGGLMTTENGRQFYRQVFYRQGMRIELDYNKAENYYGVHYYNAETRKLIFELTKDMAGAKEMELYITSLPDASGTAVVIAGDGCINIRYLVTKEGYTEEEYVEAYVERRYFDFSNHAVWNRTNLINGWLVAEIMELRGELLDYSEEYTEVVYNIHTKEQVPLPEEYQHCYGMLYQYSEGLYYGISGESYQDYKNGLTEQIYYAVCHGSKKLTEEIYLWINFGENYIIAGNHSFSHILDYEGNILAEYQDISFPFVDGKTLVCDEKGAFFIDETLQPCSGYVMKEVDYCHPGYIRKGSRNYLIQWVEPEE